MQNIVKEICCIRDAQSDHNNDTGKKFLSIELSLDGFSYCVLDTDRFRYTALESFAFEDVKDPLQLNMLLEEIVKSRKLLTESYQRISLAYYSQKMTLVPADLFSYADKNLYLDFNTYPALNFEIRVDKLNNLSAYAVYPFPKALAHKVNFLFPGCRMRHISTCLIENILYMIRYGRLSSQLVLHIQKGHFEILIFDKENLSFFNSYAYQTWDDLFYYLFFVLEQLGMQAEQLDMVMYGEVGIGSEFYKKVKLYFKSFAFGPRNELYRYSESFDDIPHHYYYNLLNLNACG